MTDDSGLPKNQKLWRVRLTLESDGGEMKEYDSVLLNRHSAETEMLEYCRQKHRAEVIADKAAVERYYADHPNALKNKKKGSWSR